MADYLLIESRDPFETRTVAQNYDLAASLVAAGHCVTLFLVQNGVLPSRKSTESDRLTKLANAGVEVLAEEFSLRERGIPQERLAEGLKAAPLSSVIDRLEQGYKALWD